MRKSLSRIMCVLTVATILFSTLAIPGFAKTLEEAFSGGSNYNTVQYLGVGDRIVSKTAWAKTTGYSGLHYVRAYIGGSANSANGAEADTGRVYSYSDNYCSCTTQELIVPLGHNEKNFFGIAYAKYGTSATVRTFAV